MHGEAKETRKAMAFTRRRIKLSEDETLGGTRIIQNFGALTGGRGGQTLGWRVMPWELMEDDFGGPTVERQFCILPCAPIAAV